MTLLRRGTASLLHAPFALQAALLLCLLAALSFWPIFIGDIPLPIDIITRSPVFESIRKSVDVNLNHSDLGDIVAGFYPVHAYAGAAIRAGSLPLWKPHLLLGQPFLANYQTAVLYPPNLLYFVLPTTTAWAIGFPLRIVLSGVFMALLAHALGASRTGSLVSGMSYAYSGFLVGWSGWPHSDVAVWLPLICLTIHRLREQPTARRTAAFAAAVAMSLYAGHPQSEFYVLLFSGIFAVHRLFPRRTADAHTRAAESKDRLHFLGCLAGGGVLALGLAAVQLLPTAEWIGLLSRTISGYVGAPLFKENILLFLSRDTRGTPNSAGLLIPEGMVYLGILPLVAAFLALLHRARRDVVFLWSVTILVFLAAYGYRPVYDAMTDLPVFHGLPNWRLLLLADFSLALLAGLGVTAMQQRSLARARATGNRVVNKTIGWWLVLTATLILLYRGVQQLEIFTEEPGRHPVTAFRGPAAAVLLLGIAALLFSPVVARRLPPRLFSGALLLVVAVDLLSYSYGHVPFIESRDAYPRPPLFDQLRARDPGVYRIAALDSVYPKNTELAYGFDAPGGTGYEVKAIDPLLADFGSGKSGFELRSVGVGTRTDRRLDLLNVKYFFTSEHNRSNQPLEAKPDQFKLVLKDIHAFVFENIGVLPRAYIVPFGGATYVDTPDEAYAVVADPKFNPDAQVVVVGEPLTPLRQEIVKPKTYVKVRDIEIGPSSVEIALAPESEGVLVLSDTWYPGWNVRVDGVPRPILRVDGGLKGVHVRTGDQQVEFAFEPRSLHVGALVTGASSLLLLALVLWGSVPRRP